MSIMCLEEVKLSCDDEHFLNLKTTWVDQLFQPCLKKVVDKYFWGGGVIVAVYLNTRKT